VHETALLLAGWGTDPRRLHPLRDALRAADLDALVWPYHPVGTLPALADLLLDRIARAPGPVHLVGHSLGGLVAAQAALARPDGLTTVTTINTPWRGTWAAYTGSGGLATALRYGSTDLRGLREALQHHHRDPTTGPSWLLLAVLGDLAAPASTALRAGVRGPRLTRRVVPATGHSISLFSPRVIASVAGHIGADRPLDAAP
jgi:pimeloyl-ACP methyl ester carboxylesterase